MSDPSFLENSPSQPLSLQELLATLLNVPAQTATRRSLPITGTMQWVNEALKPLSFIDIINATLRGIGQTIFANNPFTGLLILIAILIQSPWVAFCGLMGVLVSTVTAILLNLDVGAIRNGVLGFNGTLVGLALGTFGLGRNGRENFFWVIAVIILAAGTTILMNYLGGWIASHFKVSILGIPSQLLTWLFLGVVLYSPQPLFELANSPPPTSMISLNLGDLFLSLPISIGSIFFSSNLIPSLLILFAVILCSPISAGMGLLGALMSIIVALILRVDLEPVYLGLWGFNSALTAIALGGVFYAPLPASIGIALLSALICALLHYGFLLIFAPIGLPVLALAFMITTIGAFLILKHSIPSLVPVALYTVTCPEEHYKRYQIAKEIITDFRYQLKEAIQGNYHRFLFENATSEFKGQVRYIFNAIDDNQSGEISRSEFNHYLAQANNKLSDAEIHYLFTSMDIDKSGQIDFEEFGELILRHQRLTANYDEFKTYFIPIDNNEDGQIDSEEMNLVLASVGESPLSPEEVKFLKQKTGTDDLNWHQFIDLLLVI